MRLWCLLIVFCGSCHIHGQDANYSRHPLKGVGLLIDQYVDVSPRPLLFYLKHEPLRMGTSKAPSEKLEWRPVREELHGTLCEKGLQHDYKGVRYINKYGKAKCLLIVKRRADNSELYEPIHISMTYDDNDGTGWADIALDDYRIVGDIRFITIRYSGYGPGDGYPGMHLVWHWVLNEYIMMDLFRDPDGNHEKIAREMISRGYEGWSRGHRLVEDKLHFFSRYHRVGPRDDGLPDGHVHIEIPYKSNGDHFVMQPRYRIIHEKEVVWEGSLQK